ncbi:MAG: tetratricopeptide repeat protein [Candidatus Hodarchaeota archaeon]
MTKMYNQQLEKVEQLLTQCEFKKALNEIKHIEQSEHLTENEQLTLKYLKSTLYLKRGMFNDGNQVAEQLLEESKKVGNQLREVDALINISWALNYMGRLDDSMQLVRRGEKLLKILTYEKQLDLRNRKAAFLYRKGLILINKDKPDQALDFLEKSLSLREEIGDRKGIAETLIGIGLYYYYFTERDPNQVFKHGQKSLTISKAIGDQRGIAISQMLIGGYYMLKGELDQANKYFQKSRTISEAIGDRLVLAWSLWRIGTVYLGRGELDQALEFHQKGLTIFEKTGNRLDEAGLRIGLGITYSYKGELNQALEHDKKSLDLCELIGDPRGIAVCLNNIGCSYGEKGDLKSATDYFERSLKLSRKIGFDALAADSLYQLIRFFVTILPPESVRDYLDELKGINERLDDIPQISQRYRLAEAIVLKTSGRLADKVNAQRIFQQVAEEDIIWLELTVEAMFNLCEILLFELETSGYETVLNELNELICKLLTLAKKQYSYPIVAGAYLIQSKLKLLKLNLPEAQQLLAQAFFIAQEKGLSRLERIISIEHDSLIRQLSTWEKILEQKPSMSEIIKLTQTEDLITRMIHKRLYQNEEEVVAYAENARRLVKAWDKV